MNEWRGWLLAALAALCGCTAPPHGEPGGYYGGDRPPQQLIADPNTVADAVPRAEPYSRTGNDPYAALGRLYRPLATAAGYVETGTASWYGQKFHGRRTSSGEPYDMFAMTAAHPVLPLPSYVRVTDLGSRRSVVVRINDRGPFLHDRIIDLSYMAAHKLGIAAAGTGRVEVRALPPADGATVPPMAIGDEPLLIQVGAYTEPANARAMQRRLEQAGYPIAAVAPAGNALLHRVHVGPFPDDTAAAAALHHLETMLGHPVDVVVQR